MKAFIDVKVARFWHPTTLNALGYSGMASDSLRDALEAHFLTANPQLARVND